MNKKKLKIYHCIRILLKYLSIMSFIIYEIYDNAVLVAHSKYFMSFNYHNVLSSTLSNIRTDKSKLHIKNLYESKSDLLYDKLMDSYPKNGAISYHFKGYDGASGVDFVIISKQEFANIVSEYCE